MTFPVAAAALRRLAGALALCVATAALAAEPWTLDRAVAAALADSPDARVAALRAEAAAAAYDEAASRGLPHLSLQSGYTRTNSPMMAFGSILNQRAFDFGLDFNRPGEIDNFNATAAVALNLYNGGQVRAGKRAAESGHAAATQDEIAARRDLVAAVVRSYLNILKASEALTAVDAGARAYEAAVSEAQARFDAGQLLKAELLSLRAQLAQTQEQRLQARHQQALAERAFLFALGRPASGEPVEIAGADPALDGLAPPVSLDYASRPELQAWSDRERAAEAQLMAARGGRRPSVNAFASYQVDKGWETGEHGDAWTGGVAVNLDVFDGGIVSARIRIAETQLSELREYKRKADLGIGLEVEEARLALDEARERIAVTRIMLEHAEESAALSRARFDEGGLLAAELIGVEGRLIEARVRSAVARADERLAVAELRRAVGIEILSEN